MSSCCVELKAADNKSNNNTNADITVTLRNGPHTIDTRAEISPSLRLDRVNTSAGLSTMPRPRFSDMTKAVAVQVVMLSGTVRCISAESELLWKKDAQTCFFNVKRRSKHDFKKLPKYQVCFLLQMKSNLSYS